MPHHAKALPVGMLSYCTWAQEAVSTKVQQEITSQRLLDQSQAGVYRGKRHIPPILGLFGPIHVPYPKGLNC